MLKANKKNNKNTKRNKIKFNYISPNESEIICKFIQHHYSKILENEKKR